MHDCVSTGLLVCVCVVCEAVLGFQISSEKHGAAPAPCYSLSTENLTVCLLFPAEHDHT